MWWDSQTRYFDWLPRIWESIEELQAVAGAVEPELDALKARTKQMVLNKFPATADLEGVRRWESILGLSAPLEDDLHYRRQEIAARLRTRPPINLVTVRTIVETYLGIPVELTLQGYRLIVSYRGQTKLPDLAPLTAKLRELLPANLGFEITYAYVTWGELKAKTWQELRSKTWAQVRMGL